MPPTWVPKDPTTQAYRSILTAEGTPVLRWFANSMIAAAANAALVVVTAAMAAYPLARMEFRGKRLVFGVIIATLFIPPVILIIPNYLIVGQLGWLDTLVAVIVPTAASAFGVFFLRQFFISLPKELEEAAVLDGANIRQVFTKVVLPLSRPALDHPGPARVPHQLERLPLAGVRAVQPRDADTARGPVDPAVGQQRAVRPAHGRGGHRQRTGAAHVRPGAALHHRGRLAVRAQGLRSAAGRVPHAAAGRGAHTAAGRDELAES